jgi:2-(1,2-epoxy-1,2-dihydrophenyl)acetyl-CoA isomerase
MAYETITVDVTGYIGTLTLNRPDRLNAVTAKMHHEVFRALADVRGQGARVLIVTGAGRGFCAGADVARLAASRSGEPPPPPDEDEMFRRNQAVGNFAIQFTKYPLPTIAAVNGVAAGMGMALTLACDIRIAGESGAFSAVFVKRSLVPDTGASWMLPRVVGMSHALEMMYTGDTVSSADALAMGLVNRVVPDDQLMAAARELAGRIAAQPPLAVELTKRVTYLNQQTTLEAAAAVEMHHNMQAGQSEDAKEAVRAFVEKRPPVYTGR